MTPRRSGLLALLLLTSCTTYQRLLAPAVPYAAETPAVGEVPDGRLMDLIRDGDLVVLGTPVERVSEEGIFTAKFQAGAKETWYSVRVVVDAVAKGNLHRARTVDLGMIPAWLNPGAPFPALAANEIVVQYPEVESVNMHWGLAPVLTLGERAVFIFKKCWNCVPLTGLPNPRGPYYLANPWVAMTWGSKLPPGEWPRVVRLVEELREGRAARPSPAAREQVRPENQQAHDRRAHRREQHGARRDVLGPLHQRVRRGRGDVAQRFEGRIERLGAPHHDHRQNHQTPFDARQADTEPERHDAHGRGGVNPGVVLRAQQGHDAARRETEAPGAGGDSEHRLAHLGLS